MVSKKHSLAILSMLLGSMSAQAASVHAATSAPVATNNFAVSIPNLTPGFQFNVGALWLQPAASNLNYVILNKAAAPVESPIWYEQELHPAYAPAFQLGLGYVFPNAPGEDIQLNWVHLSSTTSSSTNAPNNDFFLGPDYNIGPPGITTRTATGKVNFKFDVVNLDVGQFIGFGPHVDMRFFGGLSTGFLREEVIATYSGNTGGAFPGPFTMKQDVTSNFTGIGPRLGLHVDYNMDCGLGFLGEAAASALIGSEYANTSFTGSGAQVTATYGMAVNHQSIKDQTVYQVVPGFDAKLGINYKHAFNHNTALVVSAGYQAAVYINAISQYLPQSLVTGQSLDSGGIFVATMSHTLSNYSVQGPFLNFAVQVS